MNAQPDPIHAGISLRRVFSLLVTLVLLAGCNFPTAKKAATATPVLKATRTPLVSSTPLPSNTPMPSNTPLPVQASATRFPTATLDLTRVAAAQATSNAADAVSKLEPDLKKYGFSTSDGYLGWTSSGSTDISTSSYMETRYSVVTKGPVADFVLQADVTWNTSSGIAGCGFMFRGTPDYDGSRGGSYLYNIQRLVNLPGYDLEYWDQGDWVATLTQNKVQRTNILNDQQNSTNTIAIVVHGKDFTPWANGQQLIGGSHDKFKDGVIALMAFQESGKTTCTFNNGWLFILK
jgi:hypothetical protein